MTFGDLKRRELKGWLKSRLKGQVLENLNRASLREGCLGERLSGMHGEDLKGRDLEGALDGRILRGCLRGRLKGSSGGLGRRL